MEDFRGNNFQQGIFFPVCLGKHSFFPQESWSVPRVLFTWTFLFQKDGFVSGGVRRMLLTATEELKYWLPAGPLAGMVILFPSELHSLTKPLCAPTHLPHWCCVGLSPGTTSLSAWAAHWGLFITETSALAELGRARIDVFFFPSCFPSVPSK